MSSSLRDQLIAAGFTTKKHAEQVERQQRQQSRRDAKDKGSSPSAEQQKRAAAAQQAQAQAQAAKAARDAELNRKRQEQAEHRARWAQVKQLIDQHVIPRPESDDAFNFVDGGKVRRIYVNEDLRSRIVSGVIVIARCEGKYYLVPAETAERIREREPRAIVTLKQESAAASAPAEDDPYKDFVVPEDLKW